MGTTVQQLLNSVQDSSAAYERCACALWKQALEDADTVYESLRDCLGYLLSTEQKSIYVERCIKFFKAFASKAPADNEVAAAFIEELLQQLASYLSAIDKTARYRSCQLLQQLLSGLSEELLLDEEVTVQLREQLAERLQDKLVAIRVEAIKTISHLVDDSQESQTVVDELVRLVETDRSKDVRIAVTLSLPLYDATMPVLLARLKDENPLVRKAVLTRLKGISIKLLSIKQRAEVIQQALKDTDAAVGEAGSALLAHWVVNDCKSDPLALLQLLDVEVYTEAAELAIGSLIAADSLQAPSSTAAAASSSSHGKGVTSYIEAAIRRQSGETDSGLVGLCCLADDQVLEPHEALIWRCLCDWLRCEATVKGLAAAATAGARAALQASMAAERHEVLERALPESADQLLQLVKRHAAAGPAVRFSTMQLLRIASTCVEWTDAASRSMALPYLHYLIGLDCASETENTDNSMLDEEEAEAVGLQLAGNGGDRSFEGAVVQLVLAVQGTEAGFCATMLDAIASLTVAAGMLTEPDHEDVHLADAGDSIRVLQCLAYINLFLQQLPCGKPADDGNMFSFSKLWELLLLLAFKQDVPEIRARAVECIALYAIVCSGNEALLTKTVQMLNQLLTSSACCLTQQAAAQGLTDIALLFGPSAVDSVLKTPSAATTGVAEDVEKAADVTVSNVLLELLVAEGEALLAGAQATSGKPKRGRKAAVESDGQSNLPASSADLLCKIAECLAKLLLHQRAWLKRYQSCTVPAFCTAGAAACQNNSGTSSAPATAAVAFPADSQQHQALLLLKALQLLLLLKSHPATEAATQLQDLMNTFFGVFSAASRNFRLQLVAAAVPAARQALNVNSKQNTSVLLLRNVLKLMQDSYDRDQQQQQGDTTKGHPVLMVDGSQATFESVAMQLLLEANYVLAYTANRGVLPAKCKPYLSSLLKLVCELPLQPSTEDLERMLALCDRVCTITTDASIQKDVASVQQLLTRLAQDVGGVQQLQPDQVNQLVASLQALSVQLPPLPDALTTAGSRSTAATPAPRTARKARATGAFANNEHATKACRSRKAAARQAPGGAKDSSAGGDESSTDSASESESESEYSEDRDDGAGSGRCTDDAAVADAVVPGVKAMVSQQSGRAHRSTRQPLGPSSLANL